jgi:hypothetical protein
MYLKTKTFDKTFTVSRLKTIEVGSFFCDSGTFVNSSESLEFDIRAKSPMTYLEKAKRYSPSKWLENQSFCFDGQQVSTLSITTMFDGICYELNNDKSLFDKST